MNEEYIAIDRPDLCDITLMSSHFKATSLLSLTSQIRMCSPDVARMSGYSPTCTKSQCDDEGETR